MRQRRQPGGCSSRGCLSGSERKVALWKALIPSARPALWRSRSLSRGAGPRGSQCPHQALHEGEGDHALRTRALHERRRRPRSAHSRTPRKEKATAQRATTYSTKAKATARRALTYSTKEKATARRATPLSTNEMSPRVTRRCGNAGSAPPAVGDSRNLAKERTVLAGQGYEAAVVHLAKAASSRPRRGDTGQGGLIRSACRSSGSSLGPSLPISSSPVPSSLESSSLESSSLASSSLASSLLALCPWRASSRPVGRVGLGRSSGRTGRLPPRGPCASDRVPLRGRLSHARDTSGEALAPGASSPNRCGS